jgi:hypothetical protein
MTKKAPNPIDKHVGSRVRMRRMMLGMSQEKLGDALSRRSSRCKNTKRAQTGSDDEPAAANFPNSAGPRGVLF